MTDPWKEHWERVYAGRATGEMSWHQAIPTRSLAFIRATAEALDAPIIDVGGGASTLVDHLLAAGHTDLTVLDLVPGAFDTARARLGAAAARVTWIDVDVTRFAPSRAYAIWHDRAAFHFLVDDADRARYLDVLRRALRPKGHVLLATFGPDGPTMCSGLPIRRYSASDLGTLLGPAFRLRDHCLEEHVTPAGATQQFLHGWWQVGG